MADLGTSSWRETDADNDDPSPDGWPEGMLPSGVNNSARANMGALKRWYNRTSVTETTGGTAAAYTLTYAQAASSYHTGEKFTFIAHATNTAAATLDINGLGARALRKWVLGAWTNVEAADIAAGQIVTVYTAAATFDIVDGTQDAATTYLAADVALNSAASFFDGPTTGVLSPGKYLVTAKFCLTDPTNGSNYTCQISNGVTAVDTGYVSGTATFGTMATLAAVVTLAAATTLTAQVKSTSITSTLLRSISTATTANLASSITYTRLS